MGRKKSNEVGKVISVRVSDGDMEDLRKIMDVTSKNATTLMREALKLVVARNC